MFLNSTLSRQMLRHFSDHRSSALTIGIALLAMSILAGVAYGNIHPRIAEGIGSNELKKLPSELGSLFNLEIILWWIIYALDVVISISLFQFYRSIDRRLTIATALFRLVYAGILAVAIIILQAAGGSEGNARDHVALFGKIWSLGLCIFGLHLVLLGLLTMKSLLAPKALSVIILIGGVCYVFIHALNAIGGQAQAVSAAAVPYLSLPMALAELLFAFWLIFAVVKAGRQIKPSLDSAE